MRLLLLVSLLIAVLLLPGCLNDAIVDKWDDAKLRAAHSTHGAVDETRTIEIDPGTGSLTVKAAYDVQGGAQFVLRDPSGAVKKSDEIGGVRTLEDEAWYSTKNPLPGTWKLKISVGGTGDYAFGFYY